MDRLGEIAEDIHQAFEARTNARDDALSQARTLTRHCANAIRSVHRNDFAAAEDQLENAAKIVASLQTKLEEYPDLYFYSKSRFLIIPFQLWDLVEFE